MAVRYGIIGRDRAGAIKYYAPGMVQEGIGREQLSIMSPEWPRSTANWLLNFPRSTPTVSSMLRLLSFSAHRESNNSRQEAQHLSCNQNTPVLLVARLIPAVEEAL